MTRRTSRRRRSLRRNSRGRASGYELWTATEDPWAVAEPQYATDPRSTLAHLIAAGEVIQRKYPNLSAEEIAARLGHKGDKEVIALVDSMFSGLHRNRSHMTRRTSRRRRSLRRNSRANRRGMTFGEWYKAAGSPHVEPSQAEYALMRLRDDWAVGVDPRKYRGMRPNRRTSLRRNSIGPRSSYQDIKKEARKWAKSFAADLMKKISPKPKSIAVVDPDMGKPMASWDYRIHSKFDITLASGETLSAFVLMNVADRECSGNVTLDSKWGGTIATARRETRDQVTWTLVDELAAHLSREMRPNRRTSRLGSGKRYAALLRSLKARGVREPRALAAWIGRRKYGSKRFQKLAIAGRRRASRRRSLRRNSRTPAGMKPWHGIDALERRENLIHNRLVAVILGDVEKGKLTRARADEYIHEAQAFVNDLDAQHPPGGARGRAGRWKANTLDKLRGYLVRAKKQLGMVANRRRGSMRRNSGNSRLFHVVVVRRDPKTGERIDDYRAQITAYPATHSEAVTIVSKRPEYADKIKTVNGRRYRASYELEPVG